MYTDVAPPFVEFAIFSFTFIPMLNHGQSLLPKLAHELRQPLSTIESIAYYLDLSLQEASPRVREQLIRLRQVVAQCSWIVNDALLLSRVEEPNPVAVDLDELISEFVYEDAMDHPGRPDFELSLAGSPVYMDFLLARQMVHNVCRLLLLTPRSHSKVLVATRVTANETLVFRASTGTRESDCDNLPSGANLAMECLERIAREAAATLRVKSLDQNRLEIEFELPLALIADPTGDEEPELPQAAPQPVLLEPVAQDTP